MRTKLKARLFSGLMALAVALSLTPGAFAAEGDVAQIGEQTYATLDEAIAAANDGDTIANNNYDGQLCIHFTNSKNHDSNKVDSYHTEAIEYAWLNAPNGHK